MGKASRLKKLRKSLLSIPELQQSNGVMMNVQGSVTEDFRKADQKYFREHPQETSYIRPAFPGEFPQLPNVTKVQVRQVEEGFRTRMPIA
ncbi:hypothetical protein HW132_32985 [Brasilonema sp. CT11]|nr:hypothetical protein [Brasilonema sp. CT11]